MGTTSSKPGRISVLKMLISRDMVTISKGGHVDKSFCKGAESIRSRGRGR